MDEQRKWFLKIETTPGENAAKTVETTAKDLSQFIKIADEVAASSERTDSNFERISTMGKRVSKSTACYRETIYERRGQLMQPTSLLSQFLKLPQPPQPPATTTLITQQPSTLLTIIPSAKRLCMTH